MAAIGFALRRVVRGIMPRTLRQRIRSVRRQRYHARNVRLSAAEVFSETYASNRWGGRPGDFYSGPGSADENSRAYCRLIREAAAEHSNRPTIVDLGCGDFRVGRQIADAAFDYIGVDVVPALIERNQEEFGNEHVRFVCADIASDPLPPGDICLLREVLQHLSNDEILRVLERVRQYPKVFITEHDADDPDVVPNLDKPHGATVRAVEGSGLFLELEPFNVEGLVEVLAVEHAEFGGSLRTLLLRSPDNGSR